VITFDGGGIRGALTAQILERIDQRFPKVLRKVDLFSGTSTGSFIALALAYNLPVSKLVELYSEENCRYIFDRKRLGLFRPKYQNNRLRESLEAVFPADLRLRDLPHKVLVPAFQLDDARTKAWKPLFFHNFTTSPTADSLVIDVALASSAAPVYFPAYNKNIDGGVIANNPSTAALAFARSQEGAKRRLEDVYLLSIGTGFSPNRLEGDTSKWGALQWMFSVRPPLPILEVFMEGTEEADTLFTEQFLGRRQYHRVDPILDEPIGLDDAEAVRKLIDIGNSVELEGTYRWLELNWVPS